MGSSFYTNYTEIKFIDKLKRNMSEADAESIAAFVEANPGLPVIVHCDAGISRSSGVGAAILKHYTGDDSSVFDNPRFHPNIWCYRKTLCALVNHNTLEGEMDYD